MDRQYLIDHIVEENCVIFEALSNEDGETWRSMSGDIVWIPFEEDIKLNTWCHVIFELKIGPPLEFDAEYHVYEGWRTLAESKMANLVPTSYFHSKDN